MSDELLTNALSVLGRNTESDTRIENSQIIREELLRSLITGGVDPQTATAAKGLLSDMDKSIFTTRRLEQDKKSDDDTNSLLNEMYQRLVADKGRTFDITPVVPVVDASRRELSLDDNEFVVHEHELITGNDTEESIVNG